MWYKGHPYGLQFRRSYGHSRWGSVLWLLMLLYGMISICGILAIKVINKWGRKIGIIASSTKNNSKLFTQFKIFGWIVTLSIIGIHSGTTIKTIHLLSTHEEYYPEYFLPESVIILGCVLIMAIIFLCEYPLIYSNMTTFGQRRSIRSARCRHLTSRHISAAGWAGPVYGVQTLAVTLVYVGVQFFDKPLETLVIVISALFLTAVIIIFLHEIYLMLRHPKNCCYCANHTKILFLIAVTLSYLGFSQSLLILLICYRDLTPLLDSTKLIQYVISSAAVALFGYFVKQKLKQLWKDSEGDGRTDRQGPSHSLDYVHGLNNSA